MNVLVIGGGGREHAIIWKLKQSPRVEKIYCAPGNAGISELAECINIKAEDINTLVDFALTKNIGLTVVGPEIPLVSGIVDEFERNNLRCFGPKKLAAEIEGSKSFSKGLMKKYNIPTPGYEEFDDPESARAYLKSAGYPLVIKADGLASGKGVIIARNTDESYKAVHEIMEDRVFKDSGKRIIIEEFIEGPEVSVLAFTDGKCIVPMESARDHKSIFEGGLGPNTGGMGTICPNPAYTPQMQQYCMERIFIPTIDAMDNEGRKFKGVLFFGLIIDKKRGPLVLEYNCRFGDPETQSVLLRLDYDLADLMEAVIDERLNEIDIKWKKGASACVILSSGGYPGEYKTGREIIGLDRLDSSVIAFHSGTKYENDKLVTAGGRVIGISALGSSLDDVLHKIYSEICKIHFEKMHYRKDIGR